MDNERNDIIDMPDESAPDQVGKARPWLLPLLASLLASFTIGVYVPLESCFSLGEDGTFCFWEMLPVCIVSFVLLFGICFGLLMLFRGKLRRVLCALACGGALAVYMQGAFLNISYGAMDGVVIDWNQYGHYGRWNLLIWLLITLAPCLLFFLKERFEQTLRFVCVLLTTMLAFSLVALGISMPNGMKSQITFSAENQFVLSKNENVLVFVLDTVNTTDTVKYLQARPEMEQAMDGFQLFQNSVGVFPSTDYAMPVILGNQVHQFDVTFNQLVERIWKEPELFLALKAADYDTRVYTKSKFATVDTQQVVENVVTQEVVTKDKNSLLRNLYAFTVFRYAPHALKKYIIVNPEGITENREGIDSPIYIWGDLPFFESVQNNELTAPLTKNAFRLYHLRGAHAPYWLQSDGTYVEQGRTSLEEVMDAYFGMLTQYFEQMKALDIYDDATIVILADHGRYELDLAPVLMIKRAGDHGTLGYQKALVSQLDVAKTIASSIGMGDAVTLGENAFEIDPSKPRTVTYYYCPNWRTDHAYEFHVNIDKQGLLNYHQTGRIISVDGERVFEPEKYTLGEWRSFLVQEGTQMWFERNSALATPIEYMEAAWFGQFDARLTLRFQEMPQGDLSLRFTIYRVVGESQRIWLMDDQNIIAQAVVGANDTEVCFKLPESVYEDGDMSVRLHFPDATSDISQANAVHNQRRAVAFSGFAIEQAK